MFGKQRIFFRYRATEFLRRRFLAYDLYFGSRSRWQEVLIQRDRLFLAARAALPQPSAGGALTGIVFSKDRPLQLDGLLQSYFALVSSAAPLTVLYATTSSDFAAAYADLSASYASYPVTFVVEQRFRDDLLDLLSRGGTDRVFFLVDDDIFIRPMDLKDLNDVNSLETIASFRLGLNIRHCYTVGMPQPVPPHSVREDTFVTWRWGDGKLDWAYATAMDGHVFSRAETLLMAEISDFNGPNSFETALSRFSSLFEGRTGLCYPLSRLVNVPANRVQAEHVNRSGSLDPAWTLAQWRQGYRLNWSELTGFVNRSPHEELDLPLTVRR